MDHVGPETRSRIMSCIRSERTKPEEILAEGLCRCGQNYWRHLDSLPGKPDFVLDDFTTVIFVDGCFFHGCKKHFKLPKSNVEFWANKVLMNRLRDRRVDRRLRRTGWRVFRIWEHDLKPRFLWRVLARLGIKAPAKPVPAHPRRRIGDKLRLLEHKVSCEYEKKAQI